MDDAFIPYCNIFLDPFIYYIDEYIPSKCIYSATDNKFIFVRLSTKAEYFKSTVMCDNQKETIENFMKTCKIKYMIDVVNSGNCLYHAFFSSMMSYIIIKNDTSKLKLLIKMLKKEKYCIFDNDISRNLLKK